jgi:hypothetical protein
MSNQIDLRQATYAVGKQIVLERMPALEQDFDGIFDALYANAESMELLSEPPATTEAGQQAVDLGMLRDTVLVTSFVIPVYRILARTIRKTTGEVVDFSITHLDIHKKVEETRVELIHKYPNAQPWIDIAAYACEQFLTNLQDSVRK